jgi:DNA-binding CsgD family transcriptional regulator
VFSLNQAVQIAGLASSDASRLPSDNHLLLVGAFDLSYQSYFLTFAKISKCTVHVFGNLTELLQILHQSPNIPYFAGVIACKVEDEKAVTESITFLKFLDKVHPDAIIRTVFFGEISNIDSVLYLTQQSDGYKTLIPSSEKGVEKFLTVALELSLNKLSKLLENLTFIVKTSTLTPKEIRVLLRVISGLTNKDIANELDNSSRTVEIHRASIFEKLSVKNAVELSRLIHGAIRV